MREEVTTTNQDNLLLTRAETLRRLRIGKTTLYGLIHSGELPQVDFGPRTKRYRVDDVERLVERKTAGAA